MERFDIDIDEDTNEITMTSLDGGSTIKFTPTNFEPGALYLYADYSFYKSPTINPPVVGPTTVYDDEDDLPSTLLWTTISSDTTANTANLTKTIHTHSVYSDGRPDEDSIVTEPSVDNWNSYVKVYRRGFTEKPDDVTVVVSDRVMTHTKFGEIQSSTAVTTNVVDLGGGVTRTDTITTTTETLVRKYSSQTTRTDTEMTAVGTPKMLIYKHNSGNVALDALFETEATDNRFYPFIPIRNDKQWVENDPIYPHCKKALYKATGGKLDKVVTELKKNEDIGDIQYIYGTFGVSLNSPEDTAKEYIYRFFQMATEAFPPDPTYPTLESVIAGYQAANDAVDAYVEWWNRQEGHIVGTPPSLPEYPVIPKREFRVHSSKHYKYDMTIRWNYVSETTHSGKAWAGAKQGQLRARYAGDITLTRKNIRTASNSGSTKRLEVTPTFYSMQEYELLWQDGNNTYRKLRVLGLHHSNRVYKNKSVNIDVAEAMGDAEESGFIIPLHTNIYRSMSLTRSTQLSTACSYLVMNSYKKVKKKWYQTSAFKIVVVVVAVVISVFTMGAGGAGILGTYGAVGASLGFVGLAAVIVGAVANAIAAMIMISIVTKVSTSLFGDKLGFIIAAIASMVAMNVGTALSTGTSLSTLAGEMMNAQNIMQLTSSVGNGISQYINASTAATIQKAENVMQQYNTDLMAINKQYEEMFGTAGQGVIDPMQFVSMESMDSFLSRTLMTGSDIADMSLNMVGSYSDMTLNTDLV